MRARKNVSSLTGGERKAFADALIALHKEPSRRGLKNRYDDFVRVHVDAMVPEVSWGHGGPAFTAWHRVLLFKFEQELRRFDDTIRIPYWDWTVDRTPTSPPWLNDLLGGDGGPSDPGSQSGKVTTGPLREADGNWLITTGDPGTNDDPLDRSYLARGFARRTNAPQLPTETRQNEVLGSSLYSLFVDGLEISLHNLVHRWVNGQMILAASPLDPVFWLHHCNIDRLWGIWMRGRPDAERYTAAPEFPSYHQPTGTMVFHDPNVGPATPTWSGSFRPVETIGDHAFGVWYEGDPPLVALETPSVTFKDIEDGRTTYAAIVFKVEAVEAVGFELISAVPAPFGLPPSLHPPAPVAPGDTAQAGRVWLSFTASGTAAVAPITVSVRCIQTGQVFNVPVTANVVPQRTAAVAFVADRSGSMGQDAGNGLTKRQKLGQALGIVAGLTRAADELALVSFDHETETVVPLGDAGDAGANGTRDQLAAAANSPALDPRGSTGIGQGILDGVLALNGASSDTVALVVITDGVENTLPYIADVAASITSATYAIGIGRPIDVNVDRLNEICQGHGRYLLVTGDLAGEELFRLHKYFLQIHAGVNNQQIVKDPAGELTIGAEHRIPFRLSSPDIAADAIVVCPLPGAVRLALEAPDGTVVRAGTQNVEALRGDWLNGLRLALPLQPEAAYSGEWTAILTLDEKRFAKFKAVDDVTVLQRGSLPYSLVVAARSDLRLRVDSRLREAQAELIAQLDAHGIPFWGEADVVAEVKDPRGRVRRIGLQPRGQGNFSARLDVPDPGLYTARVLAEGRLDGEEFTREQVVTVATVSGEASEGAPEPEARLRRKPRRRKSQPLESALRTARPPAAPPEPEQIDPEAVSLMRHVHGGTHFPSEEEVPEPRAWEKGGGRRKRGGKRKGAPKRKPGGGHEH
jgi:Common central domain of tyrosinase/von Willebrand factor type A domain